jgi:hypothetical protein
MHCGGKCHTMVLNNLTPRVRYALQFSTYLLLRGIRSFQLLKVPVMYTWLPPCVHRNTVGTLPSFAGAALHVYTRGND